MPAHLIFSSRERELDRGVHRAARATTRARCATRWRPRCGRRSTASTSTSSGPAGGAARPSGAESTTRFCRSIVDFSQLLQGITDSTMPREEGWYFLQAGKFLERAEWTARTLDVNYRLLVGDDAERGDRHALAAAAHDLQPWGTLLRSLSAYESYHRIAEQRHPAERGDRAAHPLGRPAALDPVLDREGRRRARAHQRGGARLQRLRADAGRERPRARRAARSAACTRSSPTSGSTTCSTTACTPRCSTSSAAAIASATASRTSSSPTGR